MDSDAENKEKERILLALLEDYCAKGNVEKVKESLDNKNIDLRDYKSEALLLTACKHGQLDIAKLLIERGAADRHANQPWNKQPTFQAMESDNAELVRFFLERGSYNELEDLHRCLAEAFEGVSLEIVEMLLDFWAVDVNSLFDDGDNLLYEATKYDREDLVGLLIDRGADVNLKATKDYTESALHAACEADNLEIVRMLLRHGAEVNSRNSIGQTPLYIARVYGDSDELCIQPIVDLLLQFGADYNAQDEDGDTLLHYCDNEQLLFCLLSRGARTDLRNEENKTAAETMEGEMPEVNEKHMLEITRMKSIILTTYGLNLFDIMVMNRHELTRYVNNIRLKEILEDENFSGRFPKFGSRIREKYNQGLERRELLESSMKSLKTLTGLNLPYECCLLLFKYMTNPQMKSVFSLDF